MAKRKAKPTSAQKQTPKRRQSLKAKTQNQEEYIREIEDNDVTLCTGPAGTGKTAVSVGIACDYLLDGRVDKIIVP